MIVMMDLVVRGPMQATLTNLLAVLLLVQALTGWCDSCCHDNPHSDSVCGKSGCTIRDEGDSHFCNQSHSEHCNDKHCQGICTYVPGTKTHIGASQQLASRMV